MSVHDDVDQLLAGYALGAVTDEEAAAVTRHLPDCEACTENLAYMAEVAGALPLATAEVTPPAGMRERVLANAREGARAPIGMSGGTRTVGRMPRRLGWAYPFAAAAALLVVVGGWSLSLQDQLNRTNAELGRIQAQDHHGNLVAAQGASVGTISYLAQDRVALVSLRAVAAPPAGRTYELWVIDSTGRPEPAGLFLPEPDGTKVLVVNRAMSPGDRVAVTVEPLGGSSQPTTTPVISGNI
ncbi:MAG: hypothetical protein QOE92_90 [Chloroflexota bacterium]|jgi:anti-sigma-K factor RskA|nr:hypothetical protein [Chloroflexota bacterium]